MPSIFLMNDIVLRSFEYFAKYKYDSACQRQSELVAAAMKRGTKFGRRRIGEDTDMFDEVIRRYQDGKITSQNAAKELNVSRSTFFRRLKETGIKDSDSEEGLQFTEPEV